MSGGWGRGGWWHGGLGRVGAWSQGTVPPPILTFPLGGGRDLGGSFPSEGEGMGRGPLDSSTEAGMTASWWDEIG